MGKSRDLSEFERGMIVGARRSGCSIGETVNLLGFSKTSVSRVYREWCGQQKTSSHRAFCGRKRLVDESGERTMEKVVEANSHASRVQIQALYNSRRQEKPISLTTTRRTMQRLGYSRLSPDRDALIQAGLDALAAVYPPCPEPLETNTDTESSKSSPLEISKSSPLEISKSSPLESSKSSPLEISKSSPLEISKSSPLESSKSSPLGSSKSSPLESSKSSPLESSKSSPLESSKSSPLESSKSSPLESSKSSPLEISKSSPLESSKSSPLESSKSSPLGNSKSSPLEISKENEPS